MEDDEGIEDGKMVIEKVDELKDDFNELGSDCFNHCSEEKIHCLAGAVNSMLHSGSTLMNRQKAKFIRELMLPYHETVRRLGIQMCQPMKKEVVAKGTSRRRCVRISD